MQGPVLWRRRLVRSPLSEGWGASMPTRDAARDPNGRQSRSWPTSSRARTFVQPPGRLCSRWDRPYPELMSVFAASSSDTRSELLERSRQLGALDESLGAVLSSSRGRLVLVGGEAGVGKTALVSRFFEEHDPSTRVLSSACDA